MQFGQSQVCHDEARTCDTELAQSMRGARVILVAPVKDGEPSARIDQNALPQPAPSASGSATRRAG